MTGVITGMALAGKFFISFTFNAVYIVTAEVIKIYLVYDEILSLIYWQITLLKGLSDRNSKYGRLILLGSIENRRRNRTICPATRLAILVSAAFLDIRSECFISRHLLYNFHA